ncbi:MAG: sensor histidine kinase [Deltaproteobacteria bacterium]|nr:MAG: sensor histidine kinase [Deltaproteobacteria bacterium]
MTPEDQWLAQKERMLAWLRLGFSVVAILVIELNPETTPRLELLSDISLYSFFFYSLAVLYLTGSRRVDFRKMGLATTCLDLTWISLLVLSTARSVTPFFPYYLFPVITASSRYGTKGGLITALIGVMVYWSVRFSSLWEAPLSVDLLVIRSIYLVTLAYIFGFVSDFERKQNEKLLALSKTAQEAATLEERRRIARELHDGLLQTLASLGLRLETCRKHLLESPKELAQEIELMEDAARRSMDEIRQFLLGKGTRGFLPGTLMERLREDIRFLRDGLGLRIILESDPEDATLPPGIEEQVYYVLREGLMNIARHSHASRAELRLKGINGEVLASISDDGVGFDPSKLGDTDGFGLISMKERIEKLGGNLSIETAPAKGTRISFRFALNSGIALRDERTLTQASAQAPSRSKPEQIGE